MSTKVDENTSADALIAFNERRAARMAGMSLQQLRRLDTKGYVKPSVVRRDGVGATVRLYDFTELQALLVYAQLRQFGGYSHQNIGKVLDRTRQEYFSPLTQLVFAREEGSDEIHFQHPDGTWEGSKQPAQGTMRQVLPLDEIRAKIRKFASRDANESGHMAQHRRRMANAPTFAGTRIKIETVVAYIRDGVPDDEILEAFPQLGQNDLVLAHKSVA